MQEYEIDKTLGIKGPEDVAKMGIAEYNKQCRSIVMRYASEWEVSPVGLRTWNKGANSSSMNLIKLIIKKKFGMHMI